MEILVFILVGLYILMVFVALIIMVVLIIGSIQEYRSYNKKRRFGNE